MKNFALETILIIIVGYILNQFMDWWVILVVAFLAGMLFKFNNSLGSYAAGFLAVSILWGGFAWWLDSANLGVLSSKIGTLFGGIDGSSVVYLTGLLGGILGGFSAMTGTLGRKLFEKT